MIVSSGSDVHRLWTVSRFTHLIINFITGM